MKIRMLKTITSDSRFGSPDAVLIVGEVYNANANAKGAISGFCDSGGLLGVMPYEFEFLEVSQWLYDLWSRDYPYAVEHAIIVEE